jgi:hypothetical protein
MDGMIAAPPVFAERGIRSFAEYQAFTEIEYEDYGSEEAKTHHEATGAMEKVLWEWKDGITLDEWYDSPLVRYNCLHNLERRYACVVKTKCKMRCASWTASLWRKRARWGFWRPGTTV